MKRHKTPQTEMSLFGQASEPFALIPQTTLDGAKVEAAQAQKEADHQHASTLQGVLIVARDDSGQEISRQIVPDETTATRLMIARNRPIRRERTFPKWGIETTQPGLHGTFHTYK